MDLSLDHADQGRDPADQPDSGGLSRRRFLTTSAAASAGIAVGAPAVAAPAAAAAAPDQVAADPDQAAAVSASAPVGANPVNVNLIVNGEPKQLSLDPRVTLL